MSDYDAIVIGSGAGGLTTALCLARAGKRVLVLEQHYLPGGWCHSFSLDGFQFSPGVHYVGGLGEGGRLRGVYEGLGVAGDLFFLQLNPDGYDHVIAGGERFDVPVGRDNYEARLKDRFPQQAAAIHRYFDAVEGIAHELDHVPSVRGVGDALKLPSALRNTLRYGPRTLNGMFDDVGVKDPFLRTVLASLAGDHGLGPRRASAVMHAAVQAHYLDGGWYPQGGAKAIPRAFIRALKRHGGELRVRAPVDRILLEERGGERRATGVRLRGGEVLTADVVVSNADPGMTFARLIGDEHLSARERVKLRRTTWSTGTMSLFLAVDDDLAARGFDSGNYWYSRTHNLDDVYDQGRDPDGLLHDEINGVFLTIPTLKDRAKRNDGLHTIEVFAFTPWDSVKRFAGTRLDDRPDDYRRLKRDVTERMLRAAEGVLPGLSESVVFQSLGTPITNQHYAAATEGNIYGVEKTRTQIGPFAWDVKTDIDGLFLCGASTVAHGVAGATFSGVAAAREILGCRTRDLLSERGQTLRTARCDDVPVPSAGERATAPAEA